MRRALLGLGVVGALVLVFLAVSFRIVEERYVVFRTFFGDPEPAYAPFAKPVIAGPDWYLDIPIVNEVEVYDQRIKRFQSSPQVLNMDVAIEVGYFVAWRIEEPRRLRENAEPNELLRLIDDTTYNAVRNVLGRSRLADLLSAKRGDLVREMQALSDAELDRIGIEVIDLGIRQVSYPESDEDAVFEQMKEDFAKQAKEIRAKGEARAREIRAKADEQSQVELAEARKVAAELRGEGDARSAELYAVAYNQDREFYKFLRSLEAYRRALDEQTTVVLSPDSPFLRYLFGEGIEPPESATR